MESRSVKWAATEDKKAEKQRSTERNERSDRAEDLRVQPDADFFFFNVRRYRLQGGGGGVGGVGVNRLEFDWTWRQLQSGNGSSRLWTETLAVPASLRRTNICLVLFSINTLLTGDTLVRFQEPRLMAAAEPRFHTRLAIFTPGWDICASCQQPSGLFPYVPFFNLPFLIHGCWRA